MTSETLPLLVWLSPSFPTGAFAYSHGLEWAVEAGDIADAASLTSWLLDLLEHGALRADAVILAAAWHQPDPARRALNDLALALATTRERRLETSTQGNAFLAAVIGAWSTPALEAFAAALGEEDTAYPVAVAVAAAAHGLALRPTLDAFLTAAIGNLVSAVLRLGPIGQGEAQKVIADLCPRVAALSAFAQSSTLADIGTVAWRSDLASMRHEQQYSRLFRS